MLGATDRAQTWPPVQKRKERTHVLSGEHCCPRVRAGVMTSTLLYSVMIAPKLVRANEGAGVARFGRSSIPRITLKAAATLRHIDCRTHSRIAVCLSAG